MNHNIIMLRYALGEETWMIESPCIYIDNVSKIIIIVERHRIITNEVCLNIYTCMCNVVYACMVMYEAYKFMYHDS